MPLLESSYSIVVPAKNEAERLEQFLPELVVGARREGNSHINIWRDGIRFFLIIFKIGTLYFPLKLFLPVALSSFVLGIGYYGYTYISFGRFTNMSLLLFVFSILVFLMGLISEQVSNLTYKD